MNMKDWKGIGEHWCDILSPASAVPIAIYGSEYYKGKAAIVKNKYKNGWVYYIGTDPEEKTMEYLMEKILTDAGMFREKTGNVEIVFRKGRKKEYLLS